jgi:hypothetical protein
MKKHVTIIYFGQGNFFMYLYHLAPLHKKLQRSMTTGIENNKSSKKFRGKRRRKRGN